MEDKGYTTAVQIGEVNLRRLEGALLDAMDNLAIAQAILADTKFKKDSDKATQVVENLYGAFDLYFDLPQATFQN
jgi:hypothetical protein